MKILKHVANFINQLNERIGNATSWLTTLLVLLIVVDVFFRYIFKDTAAWVNELEWYTFSIVFLLGGGYAFKHDKHVRVDLFYDRFSVRDQAWLNLFGAIFLLLPWCMIMLVYAWQYAATAYQLNESSPDPGGLSARYLIKFSMVVGFLLLLLQGIASLITSVSILQQTKPTNQ